MFHQPSFPWNKGISLPKNYLLDFQHNETLNSLSNFGINNSWNLKLSLVGKAPTEVIPKTNPTKLVPSDRSYGNDTSKGEIDGRNENYQDIEDYHGLSPSLFVCQCDATFPRIHKKNKSPNRVRLGKLTSLSVKFFGPTSQQQDYGAVALRGVSGKSIDEHLAKRHNLPVWHGTWSFTYISAHCAVKDSNSGNYIKRTNRMKYMILWVHEKKTQITPSHSQLGFA